MSSQSFEVSISKVATQVWILVLVPSTFVIIPLILLLNFNINEVGYYVIFGIFMLLALLLTIKLIKNSTRKGTLIVDQKGMRFLFNSKNIFYNNLNNQSVAWDDMNKVAYNFDTNNNRPFITLKFERIKGTYICMQEENKGLDETSWPLWQVLDNYVSDYNHVHRQHKIGSEGFYNALWFKILLWSFSVFFIVVLFYKIMGTDDAPQWINILKLLIFLIPAHMAYWIGRKSKLSKTGNRVSDDK